MANDIISLAERRAAKQAATIEPDDNIPLEGYSVMYNQEGLVQLSFVAGDQEYVATMPRDAARRLGLRVCVAAERAKRCQVSPSSAKS